MSSSAAWNKTVADAKKILGNTAKIPEQRVQLAIKFALESNKVWDGFNALREAMKKKILEQQNADSKVMNTLHQAWDEIQESDFGLDDRVQSSRRLVGNDELRTARQRLRNRNPLALASAELVQIGARNALRRRAEYLPQDIHWLALRASSLPMGSDYFLYLALYRQERAQRHAGLLKNDGNAAPSHSSQVFLRGCGNIHSHESQRPGPSLRARRQCADQRQPQSGFAASGLAEHAYALSGRNGQRDSVQRFNPRRAWAAVLDAEPANFEHRVPHRQAHTNILA